jgi:hypothetical protein
MMTQLSRSRKWKAPAGFRHTVILIHQTTELIKTYASCRLCKMQLNLKSCMQDGEIKLHANLTAEWSASYEADFILVDISIQQSYALRITINPVKTQQFILLFSAMCFGLKDHHQAEDKNKRTHTHTHTQPIQTVCIYSFILVFNMMMVFKAETCS